MKPLVAALITLCIGSSLFAQHSLEMLWQTDSVFKNPESVLYDAKSKILYVSNIGEFDKDAVVYVSKIGSDGKITKKDRVTG